MIYQIDILNGAMVLFDEDGNSYETATLTTYGNAKRTIHHWLECYGFNVADAYWLISDHFAAKAA